MLWRVSLYIVYTVQLYSRPGGNCPLLLLLTTLFKGDNKGDSFIKLMIKRASIKSYSKTKTIATGNAAANTQTIAELYIR